MSSHHEKCLYIVLLNSVISWGCAGFLTVVKMLVRYSSYAFVTFNCGIVLFIAGLWHTIHSLYLQSTRFSVCIIFTYYQCILYPGALHNSKLKFTLCCTLLFTPYSLLLIQKSKQIIIKAKLLTSGSRFSLTASTVFTSSDLMLTDRYIILCNFSCLRAKV